MTKKGTKGTYHKPKPRVAVYCGIIGSAAVASGATGDMPFNVPDNIKAKSGGKAITGNLAAIATDLPTAVKVAAPAAAGIVVSVTADKLGVNRVLAKMKAPF